MEGRGDGGHREERRKSSAAQERLADPAQNECGLASPRSANGKDGKEQPEKAQEYARV
jgi:hypothetical protein